MFLVELIASSFFYLISKQSRLDAAVSALLFKLYCAYSISFKSSHVSQFRGVEPYITCTIAYQTHRSDTLLLTIRIAAPELYRRAFARAKET